MSLWITISIGAREIFGQKGGSFRSADPRARCEGPTRGSAKNHSRVVLARPASDMFLAGHDLNRPVGFLSPLLDPNRDI